MSDSRDNNENENLVNLEKARESLAQAAKGGKSRDRAKRNPNGQAEFFRPTQAQLYYAVQQSINRTALATLPEPSFRLAVYEPTPSSRQALIATAGQCEVWRPIGLDGVTARILAYSQRELLPYPDYLFTQRQAEACAKTWLYATEPLAEAPKFVRFRSELGACFHRLPFDPQPPGEDASVSTTPCWDTLLSRMTNSEAFCAWLAGIFHDRSYAQQYVWVYGQGGDGKGAIQRFLMRLLGPAAVSMQAAPWVGNKSHWAQNFVGRRLAVFSEFEDYKQLGKGEFKALTGDDYIHVNPKYEQGYTTRLGCRVLIFSNHLPMLTTSAADLRRIIYCEMTRYEGGSDPTFEERLWSEAAAFIGRCMATYARLSPHDGPIPVSSDSAETIHGYAASSQDELANFVDEHVDIDPQAFTMRAQLLARLRFVWPHDFAMHQKLREYLAHNHGVRQRKKKIDGSPYSVYVGMRLRALSNHTP